MKILILGRDYLPDELGEGFKAADKDPLEVEETDLKQTVGYNDFEQYVHKTLTEYFGGHHEFDLIVLPYSFSEGNYTEYSGLIVAAHIRLTDEWGQSRTPLLFLGPDKKEEVVRFSSLGEILETSKIFTSDKTDGQLILTDLLKADLKPLSESQYQRFLQQIKIDRPTNYPSHHSVANDWALSRWIDLLKWPESNKPDIDFGHFKSMLYVKHIKSQLEIEDEHIDEAWKEANSVEAKIQNISGKKIAVIEDHKGWQEFFKILIENSGAELELFSDFDGSDTRDIFLDKVKQFIDQIDNDTDVYVLDLRLHESDNTANASDLTGHEVAEYIHAKNEANQVIVLTASNKVWNFMTEIEKCNAYGYIVKDSPEDRSSAEQCIESFKKLTKAIEEAAYQSYIKDLLKVQRNFIKVDPAVSTINTLLISDGSLDKLTAGNVIVTDIVEFVKDHIKKNFTYNNQTLSDSKSIYASVCTNNKAYKVVDRSGQKPNTYRIYFPMVPIYGPVGLEAMDKFDIDILSLHFFYGINESLCQLYTTAKYERNNKLSHHGEMTTFRHESIKNLITGVLLPILKQDAGARL